MPFPNNNRTVTRQSTDDSKIPTAPIRSDADTAFVAANLLNQGQVAEGPNLPPKQSGQFRIPYPQGFRVLDIEFALSGNLVTLAWDNLPGQYFIAGYRIYATALVNDNLQQLFVGEAHESPAYVRVISTEAQAKITLWLQPYLSNGLSLPLDSCPTTTTETPAPFYSFEVFDPNTGFEALVQINSGLPFSGTTTVGLGITYPNATPPLDDAYMTITGVGLEAFNGVLTIDVNATGILGRMLPTDTESMFKISSVDIGGGFSAGYMLLGDNTGGGGIFGHGEHIFLDGENGELTLDSGANRLLITPVSTGSAGPFLGWIVGALNGTIVKIAYWAN